MQPIYQPRVTTQDSTFKLIRNTSHDQKSAFPLANRVTMMLNIEFELF